MKFSIAMPPRDARRPRRCAAALGLACALHAMPGVVGAQGVGTQAGAGEIRLLLGRGDAAGALPLAERLAASEPGNAQFAFLRGVVLMDLRRDAEALAVFEQLHQLYPELPDPLNNVGLLHARAGRPDAARLALEAALRLDPSHRTARLNLAQVHLMLALRAWEQAAAQAPLDPALAVRLEAVRAWTTAPAR
jgi:Flp pilus assembly protein TadD